MEAQRYLDFELLITKKKGKEYEARVVRSPTGQASSPFRLPFTQDKLKIFILTLGIARQGTRNFVSPRVELEQKKLAQWFGSRLFKAVFCGDVSTCFAASQAAARSQGLGLRLKLWLGTPELINIPWEYLFDASLGRFLALVENTPIVRYMDMGEGDQPLAVRPPCRS